MKHFDEANGLVFQGDIMIRRIKVLPATATKRDDKVAAHSETGHHHSFEPDAAVWLYSSPNDMVQYLEVKSPAPLIHRREFDTHEALMFDSPGVYEIVRQREYTPEGWRRVED